MVPSVGVPKTIARGMSAYRDVFCRAEGFEIAPGNLVLIDETGIRLHVELNDGARDSLDRTAEILNQHGTYQLWPEFGYRSLQQLPL